MRWEENCEDLFNSHLCVIVMFDTMNWEWRVREQLYRKQLVN